ncbi:hypothetical protein Tco_0767772 [Tanacetum coccineum]
MERRTVPKDRLCILLYWSYKVGKVSVNKGKVPTEMELVTGINHNKVSSLKSRSNTIAARILRCLLTLKIDQQDPVINAQPPIATLKSVAVSSSLRLLEPKRTIEFRAKGSSINLYIRVKMMVVSMKAGNPAIAYIKQAPGSCKEGDSVIPVPAMSSQQPNTKTRPTLVMEL